MESDDIIETLINILMSHAFALVKSLWMHTTLNETFAVCADDLRAVVLSTHSETRVLH